MRHGAVDSFLADGTPLRPDRVRLSMAGAREAQAAGTLFAACGVRFDRVVTSGLPRAVLTAQQVLRACGAPLPIEEEPALQEVRAGRPDELARDMADLAFLGAFLPGKNAEAQRFLGGESIAELLDRVLPAFDWLVRDDWRTLLLVLHSAVNRALLSTALVGERAFFGGMEQQPGCINVLDVGRRLAPRGDTKVRAINLAPASWLQAPARCRTMDQLLAHYEPATA
jgi:probable phosphoglycerate mutase